MSEGSCKPDWEARLAKDGSFAESRIVCGVHWYSDVMAGRAIGSAAVARLHGDAVFNAQVALAKAEVARQREKGAKPTRDCAAEAAALAAK